MKHTIFSLILFFGGLQADAQNVDSLDQEVGPMVGINEVAIRYFGIEFGTAQRNLLAGREFELIFNVDATGVPTLSEVNGVSDPVVIDSLKAKTSEIGPFNPRIRNGVAEPSIYFLQLTYPVYTGTKRAIGVRYDYSYAEAKLEDFEYIHESGLRFDMVFGGMINHFIGRPAKHLGLGGGFKMDMNFTAKNKLIYGFAMNFYSNKLKKDYPLNTTREQLNAPPTLLVGLLFGRWFDRFNVQMEVHYAIQNLTERLDEHDRDWVQLSGWSPGILVNYPIRIGKPTPMYYYGAPTLFENSINLHFAMRWIQLSLKEASGVMVEFGVSYRMILKAVDKYKIKDAFFYD